MQTPARTSREDGPSGVEAPKEPMPFTDQLTDRTDLALRLLACHETYVMPSPGITATDADIDVDANWVRWYAPRMPGHLRTCLFIDAKDDKFFLWYESEATFIPRTPPIDTLQARVRELEDDLRIARENHASVMHRKDDANNALERALMEARAEIRLAAGGLSVSRG